MANYVKIINDSGTYLIGDGASNLSIKASGTGTSISVSGCSSPLVAVRCTGGWCRGASHNMSGSTFTSTVDADAGSSVQWWVLDKAKAQTPSAYGLVCYDTSGNLIFDAFQKQARFAGTMSGSLANAPDQTYSGITAAVVVAQKGLHITKEVYLVQAGNPPVYGLKTTITTAEFKNVSTTIQAQSNTTVDYDPGLHVPSNQYIDYGNDNYRYLVIDVSGY